MKLIGASPVNPSQESFPKPEPEPFVQAEHRALQTELFPTLSQCPIEELLQLLVSSELLD